MIALFITLLLAGFSSVALLAARIGYRRGCRDERDLIELREVRSLRRFDEGRPL